MLEALKAALAKLNERDKTLTERWQAAQAALDHAKHLEHAARHAMQDNADMAEKLADFIKAVEAEGQS